jgi:hypothetical protein
VFLTEDRYKHWEQLIEDKNLDEIKDTYKKNVTAVMLENQEKHQLKQLGESTVHANVTGGVATNGGDAHQATYDPILVNLVRRSAPNLIAFDIAGVQPMSMPTGLIFALRAKYATPQGAEAQFQEADTVHSGNQVNGLTGGAEPPVGGAGAAQSIDPFLNATYGVAMDTRTGELLGSTGNNAWNEMAFSIERTEVVAKTRALKAEYTHELATDLRNVHKLDADAELANILSTEITAEINREMIRRINVAGKNGAQGTTVAGTFDVDVDADGRWSVEKWKGLMYQLELEANQIAKETRRGRGNFIICSSNVASALSIAGLLHNSGGLKDNLVVDDTGNTFAGVLNNRMKVYIDPYAQADYITVGYKGSNQYDAGMYYCPYVPLEMYRAIGEDTFQPKIGFKSRYGIVANPFSTIGAGTDIGTQTGLGNGENQYYRKFLVTNLLPN